jgi:hypothetical protein
LPLGIALNVIRRRKAEDASDGREASSCPSRLAIPHATGGPEHGVETDEQA